MIRSPSLAAVAACLGLARSAASAAVFAHYMAVEANMGSSGTFTQDDWNKDMTQAQSIGIQGFALNVAVQDYEEASVDTAFTVAEGLGFQLFFSFDVSSAWTQDMIVEYVSKHASSSSHYKWNDKPLVSAYCLAGAQCSPGVDAFNNDFWQGVKDTLSGQGIDIALAPAATYYRDPSLATQMTTDFPSFDGFMNWWSWPDGANQGLTNLTTDTDKAYQAAVAGKGPYIMGVSAWQFKDMSSDQAWVEYSDTLVDYRWQQAIELQPDIVEIITWNDYAESHYLGDVLEDVYQDPTSSVYTVGIDHSGWRTINQYYISYYLNGSPPDVSGDTVVYWHRVHAKGLTCGSGWEPARSDFPDDAVFAWALLETDGTLEMNIGQSDWQHSTWAVKAATPTIGSVSFSSDDAQVPSFAVTHADGTASINKTGSYPIAMSSCDNFNFNPWTETLTA